MRILVIGFLVIHLAINFCFADQMVTDKEVVEQVEKNVAEQEEPVLTAEQLFFASLAEGMVVGYFDQYWQAVNQPVARGYYRKLIKILGDDSFVIQDFFVGSNKKQSNPVTIYNKYELKQYGNIKSAEGAYITWYENGQKQYALNYIERGMLDGSIQGWYKNGQQKLSGTYDHGKQTGIWTEWYENGRIKSKSHYKNGKLDGLFDQWYDNGQKSVQGSYISGLMEGKWITWNSEGDKLTEGSYKLGMRVNAWVYYVEGRKWASGHYVDGQQDGLWLYFNTDGGQDKQILYQKGKPLTDNADE